MKFMKTMALLWSLLFAVTAWAQDCFSLLAGQYTNIGQVCVSNDKDFLYVKYQTQDEWLLNDLHLYVGTSLDALPVTKKGNPKIGNFPYSEEGVNTNYFEFKLPLSILGTIDCGASISIAAHASVQRLLDGGSYQEETAWSEGTRFVEKGNWGTYSVYEYSCVVTPPQVGTCDTAFALGDTTFIDLGLTNSRWGWQITNVLPGKTSYPLYAGAGKNDISKGTHIGDITVNYTGSTVVVSYAALSGFVFDETHLYVGTSNVTTIAPGLYGNIHDLEYTSSDSYTLSGFSGEPLYIVAHAVSCPLL